MLRHIVIFQSLLENQRFSFHVVTNPLRRDISKFINVRSEINMAPFQVNGIRLYAALSSSRWQISNIFTFHKPPRALLMTYSIAVKYQVSQDIVNSYSFEKKLLTRPFPHKAFKVLPELEKIPIYVRITV